MSLILIVVGFVQTTIQIKFNLSEGFHQAPPMLYFAAYWKWKKNFKLTHWFVLPVHKWINIVLSFINFLFNLIAKKISEKRHLISLCWNTRTSLKITNAKFDWLIAGWDGWE